MSVRLIGANPGLTLSVAGERVAFVSVWRVDWSARGKGNALVMWHDGTTRVVAEDRELGAWLADGFTRHFPEVRGLAWPRPAFTRAPVDLELDLDKGLRATADDVTVEIPGPPRERRAVRVPEFDLGGVPHLLTNVFMPCDTGNLTIGGTAVPADSATAFLADAEVWSN
ncbi:hypothetical protein E1295_08700 [Nonomuraea mesophila]|uniref:Uncharacterized protein n=1 Tax=Nonomuraea mesophila TaxID=2530382 RepID=A0A4R5FTS7_9ACTN|nr:hypothetical protein [Nonomuraea mesophila]TDE57194.1 hypothetical protein E1295_08700 [Nonomuraea mesophila]